MKLYNDRGRGKPLPDTTIHYHEISQPTWRSRYNDYPLCKTVQFDILWTRYSQAVNCPECNKLLELNLNKS